jgi:uncharacterized protein YwgA
MNEDEKAKYLGKILKRVGNFSMATFKDRLIFQKTVYLIQAFGISLGYKFSWYVHGPYSPDLTKVGYKLKDIYDDLPIRKFVEEDVENKFKKFLGFIEDKKKNADYLELLASLHWLSEKNPEADEDAIIQFLWERKPEIGIGIYEDVWNELKRYGLIKS